MPNDDVENRLTQLSAQVRLIAARVDELTSRVAALSPVPSQSSLSSAPETPPAPSPDATHNLSAPMVLSALTVVCFLLVIALILRTLADSKIINQQFATWLGIAYAAILVLYGYLGYARPRRFARLYVVCGASLLFSIVFETHTRFQALSAPLAYVILGTTLAAMTFLGLRSRSPLLICFGVVGASLVGMALDFPSPLFPALAALLFVANAAAYVSRGDERCAGLKWLTLVLTLCFWLFWAMKAHVLLARGRELSPGMGLPWMLPELIVFAAGSLLIIVFAVFWEGGVVGIYERAVLPTCIVGTAAIAQTILVPYYASPGLVAAVGTAMAIVFVSLASYLAARSEQGLHAAPSLVACALVFLAVFLPGCTSGATGRLQWMFAVFLTWSLTAAGIGLLPLFARSLGMRLMSRAFQGFACVMAIQSGCLSVLPPPFLGKIALSYLLTCVCLAHYAMARGGAPHFVAESEESMKFAEYSTLLPFAAGLIYLYAGSRIVLYGVVGHIQGGADAFQAGQSLLINFGALVVAVAGIRMICAEVLVVAVAIALAGAGKVFLYDFSHLHGVPLLLAISSVGMTTAIGAVLWKQWQEKMKDGG